MQAQDKSAASNIPQSGHNLLLDAKVSGNLKSFKKGMRGEPANVVYNFKSKRFSKKTQWHEYGVGYGQNLGIVAEDKAAFWMAEWESPVNANCIVLTGSYDNQPQPKTAWKIEIRQGGKWIVHQRGVGGWYDRGRYVWGGVGQNPIRINGLRVSLFSKDKKTALKSIHFRGEDQKSWFVCQSDKTATVVVDDAIVDTRRVSDGIEVLYTFDAGKGDVIRDRSGTGQSIDLKIKNPSAVKWQGGDLVIRSETTIISTAPTKKLSNAIKRTDSLTLEAWVTPQNDKQKGPARIVSLSSGASQRNFTLGQDQQRYETRLRATSTSSNGIPSTTTPNRSVKLQRTHVVYTRDASGNVKFYINGKLRSANRVDGKLSSWSDKFQLSLGNETSGGRPWLGKMHLVAVYSRGLTHAEVLQNYQAGGGILDPMSMLVRKKRDPKAIHFERQIAPLISSRCLECHDSASKKGRLDLSRKVAAFAGGESGPVIVPGSVDESLLLDQVASGDMPPEGEPLSESEIEMLRKWIADGAVWSGDAIDPAIYASGGKAQQQWLQRLTMAEYIETVRSSVGVDIAKEAHQMLPPDLRADGFSNTAYNLNVDLKHIDAYSKLAEIIVQRMDVLKFASKFSNSRSLNTDATMRKFVFAMGRHLFRGPLNDREERNYSGIATTVASSGGSFETGVSLIIEAMLQSPRFIYRIEDQRHEGPVGQYELASRISYIIWGGPPDSELIQSAEDGDLYDRSVIVAHVDRMLKDPRAVDRSLQFISEWLDIDRLNNMQPNQQRFPTWSDDLASDMQRETLAFFEEIAWKQKRPLADLLNAQITFATPRLAKHYGLDVQKASGEESKLTRYDLTDAPARGGLLTQGSLLTIGGDDASMVTRGLFVLKDVLRGTVGDPPPGLDTTPVPSSPGQSHRMIAEKRMRSTSCGGCHTKFEPLAFGLEKFDGIGAWHNKDSYGNVLREDGEVLFPGAAEPVKYDTSAALMDLLANNDRVSESITWKLTQFALGRPLGAADASYVREIHDAAQKQGGSYASLIKAILTSDLVLTVRTE